MRRCARTPPHKEKKIMKGSEKQIAWAEKIIAQKKADALAAGISPDEWAKTEEIITRDGGAKAWIDLRNTDPKHLTRVTAIAGMPEIEAKTPAQADYARAERVMKIAEIDDWVGLPPYSLDEAEQARRMAMHERYVQATIREMGKETAARVWIDAPTVKLVEKVRPAAKEAAKKQPAEKPAESRNSLGFLDEDDEEIEKLFADAKREGDKLRAEQAKIPLDEQKKRAQQAYRAGAYARDEYALEMYRIGKQEAASAPAPKPLPEPKLPQGAYIAYQGATIGGEYVIVKDEQGHQASGESKSEAIRNLIAQREKQNFPEAPAKSPIAARPEPNWANLSAKEIAGRYADEMAQIVISAGENVTAGVFEDAGAEFAANAAAKNAGDLLRRRATQWTANHAQDIAETLAQAAETSASPHSIVEELSREYVEHAETVARTELARVREEANLDIMRAQGAEKVQFIASEDERLCPICGAHHGKVYDVRDAPVLPLHPNCRCTLVPYIGEEVI